MNHRFKLEFVVSGLYFVQDENNLNIHCYWSELDKAGKNQRIRILIPKFGSERMHKNIEFIIPDVDTDYWILQVWSNYHFKHPVQSVDY